MHDVMLVLSGCYIVYCWGVITLYIVSWGIFDPKHTRFADRAAYALKWPAFPLLAPFVMLYFLIGTAKGTVEQRTEAASRVWGAITKAPPTGSPGYPKGGYVN